MNANAVIAALGLLALSTVPTYAANDAAPSAPAAKAETGGLPKSVTSALDKGDFNAVRAALLAELKQMGVPESRAGLELKDSRPSANEAAVNALCMALEVVDCTSPEVLNEFAKDKDHLKFLKAFFADADWQETYLSCGLVPYHNDWGVRILYDVWKEEKGAVKNKPLAVALASCWGGGETWQNVPIQKKDPSKYNPVRRYKYFQRQQAKGVLHPGFRKLKAWELRFVVAIPQQDWDDESYEWAFKHINLPWDQYGWACWHAPYTDPSKFGDSVQSGEYNLPFSDESWAEATQRNGGVCGALSHYGTVAAMAHGIPAYTVGQPGHCAYAVRLKRGEWTGGFGGPDGGMHNYIFGNQAPTSYNLMEAVFKDDARIARAYRASFRARALEDLGQDKEAIAAWKEALDAAPMHPFFRKALHTLLVKNGMTPKECLDYLMETLPKYKRHGVAACNMMDDLNGPIGAMDDDSKLKLFAEVHRIVAATPASWAVKSEDTINRQSAMLKSEKAKQQLLADAFAAYMNTGDGTIFGQVLEWAVKTYVQSGRDDVFNKAFAAATSRAAGNATGERAKKMRQAYGKAIVAAEQARSAAAFSALSTAAQKTCPPDVRPPKLQAQLPGKLGKGVLFRMSTTSGFDDPVAHSLVLTPQGGRCHTDREAHPHMIVELDGNATVTGCLVHKVPGNEGRMKRAKISTSTDGATWFDQEKTDNMPSEWVVQFKPGTKAKWVRIEFDNPQPEFAHISHFLIFTK